MDTSFFNSIPKEYFDKSSGHNQQKLPDLEPGRAQDRFMHPREPSVKFSRQNGCPPLHANVDTVPGPGAYNPKVLSVL